jgi:uncharacterized membrane-anchored protein YhcB (DUF1043 family)
MKWLQDNLPVIILVVGLFIGYAELRLPSMVKSEMDQRGLVDTGDFAAVQEDVEEQKEVHEKDTEEWKRRVEKIVDILLEE